MAKLVKLECGVQHYDWGKSASESAVAKMKQETNSDKKFAELWVGTHASCPSKILSGEHLSDYLSIPAHATKFFSPAHQRHAEFCNKVPFLLKVLSIQTALSVQAHPNKSLAEQLHRENPTKYKDPNHKPELIIALTPFEALCCFRSASEIIQFIDSAPALKALLGATLPSTSCDNIDEKSIIKNMMHTLYTTCDKIHITRLREHAAAVQAKGNTASTEDSLFLRVMSQYPDDVGCWMVYFLNYVQLMPGQGLFLSDSEPHAYIYGDGVEIMACSDNVVRAGLTPKWKDVPTLLNMLRYDAGGLEKAKYERQGPHPGQEWEVQYYSPPKEFPDFSIYRLELADGKKGKTAVQLPTVGLGFCLRRKCVLNGEIVTEGECFAVPYGQMSCEAEESCLIFVASTNNLTPQSSI